MSTASAAPSYNDGLGELLDSTRYQKYLQAVSYFHHYSYKNILRILEQMPHATKVANFTAWKEQYNRSVIRGSKGIKILSPVPEKPQKKLIEKIDPDTGNPMLDGAGKKILEEITLPSNPKFEEVSVFDVSQTRGKPLRVLVAGIPDDEALYGAFFDSVKNIANMLDADIPQGESKVQTLVRFVNAVVNARVSNDSTLPQIGERFITDSIS